MPELWRIKGGRLWAFSLDEAGHRQPVERSIAFPDLEWSDLQPFLDLAESDADEALRRFGEWLAQGRLTGG